MSEDLVRGPVIRREEAVDGRLEAQRTVAEAEASATRAAAFEATGTPVSLL